MGTPQDRGADTIAALRRALVPVLSRSGGAAIEIVGEPGCGKTHTAATLLRGLPCRALMIDAAGPLARISDGFLDLAATLQAASDVAGLVGPRQHGPKEIPVATLLAAAVTAAPVVVYLDDHDEVVPERRELLLALGAGAAASRGVAVITSGSRPLGAPFRAIQVTPLDGEAIARLLAGWAGSDLPPAVTGWIAERVDGNPLFAQEYLRWLTEEGSLVHDGRRWRWQAPDDDRLPRTVANLLASRLAPAAQDEGLAAVMAAIALLPEGTEDEQLAHVAGVDVASLARSRRHLLAHGLLKEPGVPSHSLYRAAMADGLPAAVTRRVGRSAVGALVDRPRLAERWASLAGLEAEEREQLHRAAAEAAMATGDRAAAARSLCAAADLAPPQRRGQAALEAAQASAGCDYEAMSRQAVIAADLLADPTEALKVGASALAVLGRYQEMLATVARLPATAREGAAWFDRYCVLLHDCGRRSELLAWWKANPDHHAGCSARTVHIVATALLQDGSPEAAQALLNAAIAKQGWSANDLLDLKDTRAWLSFHRGDYAAAKADFDDMLASQGDQRPEAVANLLRNRAVCTQALGASRASLPDLQRAIETYAAVGNEVHRAQTLHMAAFAYFDLAEYDIARATLDEAIGVFRRVAPQGFYVQALALLTDLHLGGNERHLALARACAAEAIRVAAEVGTPDAALASAIAWASVAPLDEAVAAASDAVSQAEDKDGVPEALINALQVRSEAYERLGDQVAAVADLSRAIAVAEGLGLAYEVQKLSLGLDRMRGDRSAAGARLSWFLANDHLHAANLLRRSFPGIEDLVIDEATPPASVAAATLRDAKTTTGEQLAARPLLEVLGPTRVAVAGTTEAGAGRGRKRLEFLTVLLCARLLGRPDVSQTELCDILYPDRPEAHGVAAIKQMVFNVRRVLDPRAVQSTTGGYALGDVSSDAERFLAVGDTALWRGPCLVSAGGDMVHEAADRLYLHLAGRARAILTAQPVEAERLGRILLDRDPYDRSALALTLKALTEQGNTRGVERVYGRHCLQLAEVGVAMPQHWQTFLAQPSLHRALDG